MREREAGCPFCEISAGRAPAAVLRAWRDALVIVPRRPVTEGHVLVIPRRHVADFAEAPWTTGLTALRAAQYARTVGGPMNLITSRGREATQSVYHLHLHLVPRRMDDGLALPWCSGKRRRAK